MLLLALQLLDISLFRKDEDVPRLVDELDQVVDMRDRLVQGLEAHVLHVEQDRLDQVGAVRDLVQVPGALLFRLVDVVVVTLCWPVVDLDILELAGANKKRAFDTLIED